jgi:hypothetical protein
MLDFDLAELYGVDTKAFIQSVKRNLERFPEDFMFQLNNEEFEGILRSQIVTAKDLRKRRFLPFAFTEHGVAMLSSVLKSSRAIQTNIQIMRAFTEFRHILIEHKDLRRKIEAMENKYDNQFKVIFDAIKQLLNIKETAKKKIGF